MATIVTRSGKGSPLTNNEVDANFTNLNTDKAELSGAAFTGPITTNSTVDGRDVATDGAKLDTVESSADVTDTANVTAAGALMDSELTSIASVKALNQGVATGDSPTFAAATVTGEITANGGIALGDNDKATFGAGDDLQIYHDGSNSFINETGTGSLYIGAESEIQLRSYSTNEKFLVGTSNGATSLYYNGVRKLDTTSTGIDVTGTITANDLTLGDASPTLNFNDSDIANLNHYITSASNANLYYAADSAAVATGKHVFTTQNVERFEISATGIDVTGTATMDGLVSSGNAKIGEGVASNSAKLMVNTGAGASAGIQLFQDGTESWVIQNPASTTALTFSNSNTDRLKISNNGDISFYEDTGTTPKLTWDASAESLNFADNGKATFGAGSDLQIYHDGSNSYIKDAGSGFLVVNTGATGFLVQNGSGQNVIQTGGNDVTLRYGASTKLATTATGIDVTGTATMDGLTVDNGASGQSKVTISEGGVSTRNLVMYSPAINSVPAKVAVENTSSPLAFELNGSEAMRIDSSGRVGIGTSSPAQKMHVVGTSRPALIGSDNAVNIVKLYNSSTGSGVYNGLDFLVNSTANSQINTYGMPLTFGTSASNGTNVTERMRIDSSGDVIIGTQSQGGDRKVSLRGGSAVLGYDSSATAAVVQSGNVKSLKFCTGTDTFGDGEAMRIDSAGLVGIGTSSPTGALDIGGQHVLNDNYDSLGASFTRNGTYGSVLSLGRQGVSSGVTLDYPADNAFALSTAGTERLRIDSSGRVGIGTSSPDSLLHLSNSSGPEFRIENTNLTLTEGQVVGGLVFEQNDLTGGGTGITGRIQMRSAARTDNNTYFGNVADMDFLVSGSTDGAASNNAAKTAMTIRAGTGNVGIGTSSPSYPLDIAGASGTTLSVRNTSTVSSILLSNGSSTNQIFSRGANSSTGRNLAFIQGTSEAMRIDSSGNLFVGKTNVTESIEGVELRADGWLKAIRSGDYAATLRRNDSDGGILEFNKDGTTVGSIGTRSTRPYFASTGSGVRIGSASILPCNSSGTTTNNTMDIGLPNEAFKDLHLSGKVNATSFELTGSGNRGVQITTANTDVGYINFGDPQDTNAGLIAYDHAVNGLYIRTAGSERARIDSSGNLLVGTTEIGTVPDGARLMNDGQVRFTSIGTVAYLNRSGTAGTIQEFRQANTSVGYISVTGSATSYNTSSDQRLKENIADADDAGSKIDAIQVRKFDWKADGSHQDYGMIAQELQSVAPEAVSGDADSEEMMGVDYSKLVPMLIKEIQSLRNRVAQLEE